MTFWSVARGLDCSLRSADYELLGVFHGRCAAALGHSGGAQWQNCPWCPPAKPVTVIGVEVSDEDENFILMTRFEEMNYAALTIQRGWRWTRKKDCASGRKRGAVAREVSGGPATPCGVFTSGSQRQEKDGES